MFAATTRHSPPRRPTQCLVQAAPTAAGRDGAGPCATDRHWRVCMWKVHSASCTMQRTGTGLYACARAR
eukprot:352575-Chlamydomonas_euryale.AAC.4